MSIKHYQGKGDVHMKRIMALFLVILCMACDLPDAAFAITGTVYEEPTATPRPTATPKPTAAPKPTAGATREPSKTYTIKAVGAYIQEANKNNQATGKKYSSVQVTNRDNIVITATVNNWEKVDCWVINGVRYDFDQDIHFIRLTKATQDFTFEAVKGKSSTLLSASKIQSQRTGEKLVVKTKEATMKHLKSKNEAGGPWFANFDFTNDYTNKATEKTEKGGQVSLRVYAKIPQGYRVRGWKFNDTELYTTAQITTFFVRTLNASMTYEPIFGKLAATKKPTKAPTKKPTKAPTKKPTKKPTKAPTPVVMCKVTCSQCSFGGKTSGSVPKGTVITVNCVSWLEGIVSYWEVNGSHKSGGNSITITITKDTHIHCEGVPM